MPSQSIADTMGPLFHREAQMRELARLMTQYPECAVCQARLPGNRGKVQCLQCGCVAICSE